MNKEGCSMADMLVLAQKARLAALKMSCLSVEERNRALLGMSAALEAHKEAIFAANFKDMKEARKEGLAAPLLKRLNFDENKLEDVRKGLVSLSQLPDPIGHTQMSRELMPGLELEVITLAPAPAAPYTILEAATSDSA